MSAPSDTVPELGPLLGRFSSPAPRGPDAMPLDDLRRRVLGSLYQRTGSARRAQSSDRIEAAKAELSHSVWLMVWREALQSVGERVLGDIDRRFDLAAEESRMPARLLAQVRPSAEDRRVTKARLEAAGIPLEKAAPPEVAPDWHAGLLRTAIALDASWERLERVVVNELGSWTADIERVRAWRRPTTPLWIITALTLLVAGIMGLSLGGYLPAPGPLGYLQQWFWSLPWR